MSDFNQEQDGLPDDIDYQDPSQLATLLYWFIGEGSQKSMEIFEEEGIPDGVLTMSAIDKGTKRCLQLLYVSSDQSTSPLKIEDIGVTGSGRLFIQNGDEFIEYARNDTEEQKQYYLSYLGLAIKVIYFK